jgi:ribosome-interacting GTPase 1
LHCYQGNILYNDTKIQLLDLPGIIEGAAQGKGRGREVIAVARCVWTQLLCSSFAGYFTFAAGLPIWCSWSWMLAASTTTNTEGSSKTSSRVSASGQWLGDDPMFRFGCSSHHSTFVLAQQQHRLNKRPPDIYFKRSSGGGIKFNSVVKLTKLGDDPAYTVNRILHEYRIHNCEVLFRDDCSADDLIDVIEGNRKYIKCLYAYNKVGSCSPAVKLPRNFFAVPSDHGCNCMRIGRVIFAQIDTITLEEVDQLARLPHSVVMSVHMRLNLDELLRCVAFCAPPSTRSRWPSFTRQLCIA